MNGGGIFWSSGRIGSPTNLKNAIVTNNTVSSGNGPDLNGSFISQDYNLIGNTSGATFTGTTTHNITNVNALLGPLANNGGPTMTHALLPGSPAINAGSNALAVDQNGNALITDQRGVGFPRIIGGTVDIGAFELGNRIDLTDFFVKQHYLDFLNRQADQSGLNFWNGEIDNCTPKPQCTEIKRINVSAAFYLSIEFQDTGYLVERIYKAAYGDAIGNSTFGGAHQLSVPIVRLSEFLPDTQAIGQGVVVGVGNWQQQLETNKQAFTTEFVQRSRFTTALPFSMTSAEFVDKLNTNAGNPLSPAERNQLVNDLTTSAKTRAQVLRAVADDQDLNNAEFNRAFVLMQFFGYLRRNPNDPQDTDYTGYDFWLTKLNQFNGNFANAEMVKAFINSSEYRQRFGP
jgi:hypothetical protein